MTDTRLSHSSATTLIGCEQRYWHYKVNQTPKDIDFDDNGQQFAIGKSFHYILETTKYRHPKESLLNFNDLLDYCEHNEGLDPDHRLLVVAMVLKFLRVFKPTGLQLVACEFEIPSKTVIGFVDSIVKKENGDWYILDLKTAKNIYGNLKASLPKNRQLNLYAYFYKDFAKKFDLDLKKFKGCYYWVTTKVTRKRRPDEKDSEYILRVAEAIKSIPFKVNAKEMNPKECMNNHERLYKRSLELREGATPCKNFENCFSYFTPCPYWSNCHGDTFTTMSGE